MSKVHYIVALLESILKTQSIEELIIHILIRNLPGPKILRELQNWLLLLVRRFRKLLGLTIKLLSFLNLGNQIALWLLL